MEMEVITVVEDNIQYLVAKQVRPVIKKELHKMKDIILEAIIKLESTATDNTETEWESIGKAFNKAERVTESIAEMKAALWRDQQWNFVPNLNNNHAQAYAKLAIQSLQENGENISDDLSDKIVRRMNVMFDDYNDVEALKRAFE